MFPHYARWFAVIGILLACSVGHGGGPTASASQEPPQTASAPGPGRGARGGGRGAPPVISPEVSADRRVTFRLRAPNAKQVAVAFGGNTLPMTNDGQGLWSVTTDPLAPNYYTYALSIDGTTVNDPANRQVQTSYGAFQSMFVVPGAEPWFPVAGVHKGALTRHTFRSTVAGDSRDFHVYTPAGYDPKRRRAYPVLYLLHGLGDDAERWMNGGGAPHILDNLIAQGKAVPMVVVTTLGYGVSNGPAGAMAPESITGYTRILLTEVMPAVEQHYHVSRDRDTRAIAGLSMGGAEALYAALNNLDRFSWIGSFSGAFVMWPGVGRGNRGGERGAASPVDPRVFASNFPGVDAKVNSKIRLLWITCGTADGLVGINRQFKEWLKAREVKFEQLEAPGVGHVWPFWRSNLTEFAQRVFK